MDSPVDVGGFAELRKILCQCALLSVEQLSVHPQSAHGEPDSPTKGRPTTVWILLQFPNQQECYT